MSLNLSHPSQKQSLLVIIGIGIAVVLLLVLGGVYGSFLKTQVAAPAANYSAAGNLKSDGLEPGTYTLKFSGRDVGTTASQSLQFQITGASSLTPTPDASVAPTSTATPALPY